MSSSLSAEASSAHHVHRDKKTKAPLSQKMSQIDCQVASGCAAHAGASYDLAPTSFLATQGAGLLLWGFEPFSVKSTAFSPALRPPIQSLS